MQPIMLLRPILFAIFLWWFTTGLIIVVYGRSRSLMRLCFVSFTVALLVSLVGVVVTRPLAQPLYIYLAFTSGLLIWGWQTASYYLGYITGPRSRQPAHPVPPADPNQRFWLALRSGLYHELTVLLFLLLLGALTWSFPNKWAFWIFFAMWLMHSSAKLNVFLGVRNFRLELLPDHLHHLDAYIYKRPSNPFFPISVIVASCVALTLLYHAIAPATDPAHAIGYLLVATMIGLGVIEQLLLVLPMPVTLWGWGIRRLPPVNTGEALLPQRAPSTTLRVIPKQMIEG